MAWKKGTETAAACRLTSRPGAAVLAAGLSLLMLAATLVVPGWKGSGAVPPGGRALAAAGSPAGAGAEQGCGTPVVAVSGEGVVRVAPDLAYVTVSVESQARTPGEAQAQSARKAERVLNALREQGVAAADLQTAGYSLYPVRDREGQATIAYRARHVIRATVRAVDRVGLVIDAALRAGADEVDGIRFAAADESALEARALAEAVADATRRARAMAAAAGLQLGPIRSMTDGSTDVVRPLLEAAAAQPARAMAPSTPVEPGEIEVRARVQVVFALAGPGALTGPSE